MCIQKKTHNASLSTVKALCSAINRGDIDAAINFYEPDATIISESRTARGLESIRGVFKKFLRIKPNIIIRHESLIEDDDFIICCFLWELSGISINGSRFNLEGNSIDVLRKQSNGEWRIAIEAPWGASISI
jgi:ketosteroid isomerase-like protein